MPQPILMPKPGQMTEECTLIAWHKREGDPVHRGDVLFEIETDKAAMDVESFSEGVLLQIVVQEGQAAPVNSVCAWVGQPGEAVPDAAARTAAAHAGPDPTPATAPFEVPADPLAPAVTGGPDRPSAAGAVAPSASALTPAERLRISPRARRLAAARGVDPHALHGSGPFGRITERDVQALADAGAQPAPSFANPRAGLASAAPPPASRVPVGSLAFEDEDVRPLTRMRQVIAQRLTQSVTTTPHFAVTVAVDVTDVLALRAELRARARSYSVTDFVMAATAQTLAEFPLVNARTDGTSVWHRTRVHLGLAVSVPAGLLVPVVRDADRLTIGELHDRIAALIAGARAGALRPDDLSGGTFTVSNMGMFGIDQFSAIINPGEAAILAVASVVPMPVVIGDGIGIRQLMKLTLSADHRLVDGELAARFLNALRRRLEDVEAIRREISLA